MTSQASELYSRVEESIGAQPSQVYQGARQDNVDDYDHDDDHDVGGYNDDDDDSGGGRRKANRHLQRD